MIMEINKKKVLRTFILLIGFCGTIGLIIAGFNNVEVEIKDKAEDIVFAEENITEINCAEKTFIYFNITNDDIEARQLAYLIGQNAQGKTFSKELMENMTNKTLEAYIFLINCLYNITNETMIPIEEENQSFKPIENYTHPLEGQIIKWYYNEDEEEPTPTPSTPAIPEFGNVLLPMMIMLVSVGRMRI